MSQNEKFFEYEKNDYRPNSIVLRLIEPIILKERLALNRRIVIEDCLGESIHFHWRQVRFEFNMTDFSNFVSSINCAEEELIKWESSQKN